MLEVLVPAAVAIVALVGLCVVVESLDEKAD